MFHRKTTLWYTILVMLTLATIILGSVHTEFTRSNLAYKAWLPFNYTRPTLFIVVYIHQMIGVTFTALMNIAYDCLIFGIILHICCQFEILEYRLTRITHGRNVLRDCIRHHNHIFELVFQVISLIFQNFDHEREISLLPNDRHMRKIFFKIIRKLSRCIYWTNRKKYYIFDE